MAVCATISPSDEIAVEYPGLSLVTPTFSATCCQLAMTVEYSYTRIKPSPFMSLVVITSRFPSEDISNAYPNCVGQDCPDGGPRISEPS